MTITLNGSEGITLDNGAADGAQVSLSSSGYSNWNLDNYSGRIRAYYGSTEYFTINSSGNVGIGTSSPSAKLNLTSTGNTTADGVRLTLGSEARSHNIYSALSTGRDLTIAPYRALTINTGSGTTEGVLALNAYEYTTFGTGSSYTERARIDSSGNLLVGITSTTSSPTYGGVYIVGDRNTGGTNYYAQMFIAHNSNTNHGIVIKELAPGGGPAIAFRNSSMTAVGEIATSATNTSYGTSSDYRLKENIAPMVGALSVVQALKPCTYNWKVDGSEGQGFIAHELAEVVPDCVTGEKDAVDADGNPVYQGIDTSFLVATLTAAIQEQQAIIESLKTRIETLENK